MSSVWDVTCNGKGIGKVVADHLPNLTTVLKAQVGANGDQKIFLEVRQHVLVELCFINWPSIRICTSDGSFWSLKQITKLDLHTQYDHRYRVLSPLGDTLLPFNYFLDNVRGLVRPEKANMNLEKRYTLVVGPNNCGKSTFLFALQLWVKAANSSVQSFQWVDKEWDTESVRQVAVAATPRNVLPAAPTLAEASLSVTFAPHAGLRETGLPSLDFVLSFASDKLSVKPGHLHSGVIHKPEAPPPATYFLSVYVHSEIRFETHPDGLSAYQKLDEWIQDEAQGRPINLHGMVRLLNEITLRQVLEPVMKKAFDYFERFKIEGEDVLIVVQTSDGSERETSLTFEGSGFKKLLYLFTKILLCDKYSFIKSPFNRVYYFLLLDEISTLLFPRLSKMLPSLINTLFENMRTHLSHLSRSYTVLMTTDSPTFFSSLREQSNLLVFIPKTSTEFMIQALQPSSAVRLINDSLGLNGFDVAFLTGVKILLVVEGSTDSKLLQLVSTKINAMCQACEMLILSVGGHIEEKNVTHLIKELDRYSGRQSTVAEPTAGSAISSATSSTATTSSAHSSAPQVNSTRPTSSSLEKIITIIDRDYHHDAWVQKRQENHAQMGAKHKLFVWSVVEIENLVLQLLLPPDHHDPISWLLSDLGNHSKVRPALTIIAEWLERFYKNWRATSAPAAELSALTLNPSSDSFDTQDSDRSDLSTSDESDSSMKPTSSKKAPYNPLLLQTVTKCYEELINSSNNANATGRLLVALKKDLETILKNVTLQGNARWQAQHFEDISRIAASAGKPTNKKKKKKNKGDLTALDEVDPAVAPEPPAELWRFMDVKNWLNISLNNAPQPSSIPNSLFQADIKRLEALL